MEESSTGESCRTARGGIVICRPAKHIVFVTARGIAEAGVIPTLLRARDAAIAACGGVSLFDDLELLSGYDSRVRIELTAWVRDNEQSIFAHHILVRSKIVAMGVAVAALALGSHIAVHARRETFSAKLRAEVAR